MVVARKNITFAALLDFMEAELSNGVMVAQQVLVLFVVVRIRLGQQRIRKEADRDSLLFCFPFSRKKGTRVSSLPFFQTKVAYLTAPAKSAPALNLTTFLAGIVTFCFVSGLIP